MHYSEVKETYWSHEIPDMNFITVGGGSEGYAPCSGAKSNTRASHCNGIDHFTYGMGTNGLPNVLYTLRRK